MDEKDTLKVLDKKIELSQVEKEKIKERGKWQVNIANAWGTAGTKIAISFSVGFIVGFGVATVLFRIATVFIK